MKAVTARVTIDRSPQQKETVSYIVDITPTANGFEFRFDRILRSVTEHISTPGPDVVIAPVTKATTTEFAKIIERELKNKYGEDATVKIQEGKNKY